MVHSELQILVLLYGQDGADLVAMTSGLGGSWEPLGERERAALAAGLIPTVQN
jgi:hypothetical protein